MMKKHVNKFPFEVARDIAYFELHKVLTDLNARAGAGEHISYEAKMAPLKRYENRTEDIYNSGLSISELKEIVEDIKVNPIALKTYSSEEKKTFMINELELLINDDGSYEPNKFVYRLIYTYGYNESQVDKIIEAGAENNCGSISLFDRVNDLCQKLKAATV